MRPPEERTGDFSEFHGQLPQKEQQKQAARCMDCGIPFCQAGVQLAQMTAGCPLHNLVPEVNDLVYRGQMEEAWHRLSMTHSFPEFTSRVCPALCEAACTCGLHAAPVATRENEKAVVEYAYAHGLVKEKAPTVRTGKKVAIVGSGPAGLSAAQLLNRRGHEVTVYERSDRAGGLLRYGIPNMKLDKAVIDRRLKLMEDAGVHFALNADVGKDLSPDALLSEYDSVLLSCGASQPRDLSVPGREAKGIRFAVDFLRDVTRHLFDGEGSAPDPAAETAGKDVLVIGGGDTGNDCVATAIRLGAKSVLQLEMMPEPPAERSRQNPWPEWPRVKKTDYGQEEAAWKFGSDPRVYQTTVKEFISDEKGCLKEAVLLNLAPSKDRKTGRTVMKPVEGSERRVPAQLALIAAGFTGAESYVMEAFGTDVSPRGGVQTKTADTYAASKPGIYTAGDMHRGPSLVVWAIAEGRAAAREIDRDLMGYTNL